MNMRYTSKHSEIGHWWFESSPSWFWSFVLHCKCWAPIENMNCTINGFGPKCFRHLLFRKHAPNHIHNSIIVRFFRSATPFSIGLYGAVIYLRIPFSLQKWVNSPPRSVRRPFMAKPLSFSTWFLYFLKLIKASDFSAKKETQTLRL